MSQKIIKIFFIIFISILTSCGFKVVKKSKDNNYEIREINTSGDNRINYQIKNFLMISSIKDKEKIL